MEAYNVKYGTKVKIVDDNITIPPDSYQINKGDIITIFNLDGKYCSGRDEKGNRIYIAAWTEVEEIKNI